MDSKYLAYIRSINAVRIFLNIMGFSLDDFNDINSFSKIKIRNKDMKVVGKLIVNSDHLAIKIKDNSLSLKATCNISGDTNFWVHKIVFETKQKNGVNFNGEFSFSAACDSRYDRKCVCMPSIVCTLPAGSIVKLRLLHDGKLLNLNYSCLDYTDSIEVTNGYNNFIRHVIENDYYDKKENKHHYKLYSGVFNSPEFSERADKLHLIFSEKVDKQVVTSKEEYVNKAINASNSELLIQKGSLMHDWDTMFGERIKQVRNLLKISDTYLLENLISVCLSDYSDEELYSLFEINKNKNVYQDNEINLAEAYFGDKKTNVKKRKLTS